jgi:hypothetical protein
MRAALHTQVARSETLHHNCAARHRHQNPPSRGAARGSGITRHANTPPAGWYMRRCSTGDAVQTVAAPGAQPHYRGWQGMPQASREQAGSALRTAGVRSCGACGTAQAARSG